VSVAIIRFSFAYCKLLRKMFFGRCGKAAIALCVAYCFRVFLSAGIPASEEIVTVQTETSIGSTLWMFSEKWKT